MADSTRHELFYIPEVTYGTTPSNPAWTTVRHTGTTLGLSKNGILSEELRADRQIHDFRHGTKQIGGDIAGELSYASQDDFLEAALGGTWGLGNSITSASISAAAADNSLNHSGDGFPVFYPGEKISISGFTGTAGNNQTVTVVSRTESKIIVTSTTPLVNDAAGESVTLTSTSDVLKAGTTRRSFSFLRHFTDLDNATKPWHVFTGVEINTLNLTLQPNAIVGITFGVLGQAMSAPATAAPSGSTYVAANDNDVMDCFSGVIRENGSTIAVVTEQTLTLENGLEARFVIGSDTTIRPSIQRSNLTANITTYFEDSTLLEKFINETESSEYFTLEDFDGNQYVFILPRIKYNGGQPDTQGQGPITVSLPIQALRDEDAASQIVIIRNDA